MQPLAFAAGAARTSPNTAAKTAMLLLISASFTVSLVEHRMGLLRSRGEDADSIRPARLPPRMLARFDHPGCRQLLTGARIRRLYGGYHMAIRVLEIHHHAV